MAEMIMRRQKVFSGAELDEHDRIRPAALLDLFQQLAGEHATLMGFGFAALLTTGRLWVITRLKAEIENQPALFEPITAETWPEPPGRMDFNRDYRLLGADGRVIARGVSKWCVIDLASRRPLRAQDILFPGEFCPRKTFEGPFPKVLLPDDLPFAFPHPVRRSDLDHNGHMNNARYGELLLNAVPVERSIRAFQIDFHHEAKLGQIISVYAREQADTVAVRGVLGEADCFSALLETAE